MLNREKNIKCHPEATAGERRISLEPRVNQLDSSALPQNDKQRARKEKLRHVRQSIERLEANKDAFINLLHLARTQSRVSASRYIM